MSFSRKLLDSFSGLLRTCIRVGGGNSASIIAAQLAEELAPTITLQTPHGKIRFFCPGRLPEMRATTLLTKEPETIEWIDSFSPMDVFWDIGANVGVYTLYAALRNVTCVSFEPAPGNFYLLNRNIEINGMDRRVSALCIALYDQTLLDSLFMSNTELGSALNSFAETSDWKGRQFAASFRQAMIGFSVDDFVRQFNPPFPNHIKIDVDGIEGRIIKGAGCTLADERLKSVLVKLDSSREDYCREVAAEFEKAGLSFSRKAHSPMVEGSEFASCYNYVFIRV